MLRSLSADDKMLRPVRLMLLVALFMITEQCIAFEYRVGDLNCWGVPPTENPNLYSIWSHYHTLQLGDSLLFLYPPSQDSVIQVTERAFASCNIGRPILKLNDGNSVFNLTSPGRYYFTSATSGHCQKRQQLAVAVPYPNGSYAFPPSASDDLYDFFPSPAGAPWYPIALGPSASAFAPRSSSASDGLLVVGAYSVVGMIGAFVVGIMLMA